MSFSERHGIASPKKIQDQSMDEPLRNGLWDTCWAFTQENWQFNFYNILWTNFFNQSEDTFPEHPSHQHQYVRQRFFKIEWYRVYELIEFMYEIFDPYNEFTRTIWRHHRKPSHPVAKQKLEQFTSDCNEILKREKSAYRVISGKICKITSETEIKEIEKATHSPVGGVGKHITKSMELLYDREKPDYENSIKESISAVELTCAKITGQNAPILSAALDKMEKKGIIDIHPALKIAFVRLYGYTSSGEGIRHANISDGIATPELAQFFLVACSAFTNYLITLATNKGIDMK